MSRVIEFCDGAERGDVSWWSSANATIASGVGEHGSYCYLLGNSQGAQKTITTPMSEFYFKCYVKFFGAGSTLSIAFRAGNTSLVTLTQDITLIRLNITGATTGNTGNNSISFGWQCLEVHYKINDTVGDLTVKMDDVQVFTFSGDTKPGADSTIDNLYLSVSGAANAAYIDDFALDTADWCGLGYYIGLTANGAGDVTQWTPTGAANYQNVSIPANDSTFNTGTTGQTDNYAMTTTTIGAADVLRVIPWARASNSAGGTIGIGLKTESTNYTASVATPTALTWLAGSEYINNPNTGNTWQQAEFDALQMTVSVP